MAGEQAHGPRELARSERGYERFLAAAGGLDNVDSSLEDHEEMLERLARPNQDLPWLVIALLAPGEQDVHLRGLQRGVGAGDRRLRRDRRDTCCVCHMASMASGQPIIDTDRRGTVSTPSRQDPTRRPAVRRIAATIGERWSGSAKPDSKAIAISARAATARARPPAG